MASAAIGSAYRHLRDLFGGRSVVGLGDGQLLRRYASSKDGAAFEALVGRHGPLVLSTCRAVLRNEHDVEDAFQATFLVLARKAGSVQGVDSLGGWLHRVAYRASLRLAESARRRRRKEAEASAMVSEVVPGSRPDTALGPILHEEISRLPDSQRLTVVLCDLEGLSYEQAADQLGWTVPTFRYRLVKARQKLRDRLSRRGITASAVVALMAGSSASGSIVPALLVRSTVAAGTRGVTSAGVLALTQIILRGMLMTKIQIGTTALLAALGLATAGVIASGAGRPDDPKEDPMPQSLAQPSPESGEIVRVVDPDGKPIPGASVFQSSTKFRSMDHLPVVAMPLAETGPDGSFRLSSDAAKSAADGEDLVLARAEGYGPAFADPKSDDGLKVLRLVRDAAPIRGRLLDVDGRAVVGASVQLVGILRPSSGSLDGWLDALKKEKAAYPVEYRVLRSWSSDDVPSLYPAVLTDAEGRFTIKGVGRERVASLLITGPGIEAKFEYVATREMPTISYPAWGRTQIGQDVRYHGASFDLIAGPGLEIVGTVKDKETGKPLSNAVVQTTGLFGNPLRFLRTTTDAEGRYRLPGVTSKNNYGDGQQVLARVDGEPYLQAVQSVGEGSGTITRDFDLKRGVWARGRVTDGTTGQPVQAQFDYYIFEENPHLKEYPRYGTINAGMPFQNDDDGRYQIVVMPGRGVIVARAGNEIYRLGVGADRIEGLKGMSMQIVNTRPSGLIVNNFSTLVEVNPKVGDESVTADIILDRGRTLKGKLVGPDGEPVVGAWMLGAEDHFESWSREPLPSDEFEVHALGSENKRGLLFVHEGKKLAGSYVVKPDEEGPLTIKLQPCGTLTGRLVDDDGRPQADVPMNSYRPYFGGDSRFDQGVLRTPLKTDKEGRFEAAGLVPGLKYNLSVRKGAPPMTMRVDVARDLVTSPGESKDLGDITSLPPQKPAE
ncbi:sigma-70 family RNA polymerase sigma factor [Tundrisphaera lichenicola]|uniref:sigma-70 family RNA polymerase sigma factor n=1 Tax=Tundrisphaera lichenicola TaxID=2029860 RepID=UPI003EB734EC